MQNPFLLMNFYNDCLKKLEIKYLQNKFPSFDELTSFSFFYSIDKFYHLFNNKKEKIDFSNYNNYELNLKLMIEKCQIDNYPRYQILLIYSYVCYHKINNIKLDIPIKAQDKKNLDDFIKKINKNSFSYNLQTLNYIDYLNRTIIYYPGNYDFYKNASKNAYYYYKYFYLTKSKIRKLLIKKTKIIHFNNLTINENIYKQLIDETVNELAELNKYLYKTTTKLF